MENVYKIKTKLKTPGFKPIAKVDCTFFDTSNPTIGYPGICYIFGFDNGYGAEVRKNYLVNGYTENKWELDLLCKKDGEWVHDIQHAITGYNFLDYLSDADVTDILTWIRDGRLDEAWCANEIAEDYHDISDADIYDDYGDGEEFDDWGDSEVHPVRIQSHSPVAPAVEGYNIYI